MFTFVARPVIGRLLLLAILAGGIVVGGAWLAGLLGPDYPHGREWLGLLAMAFFGLCAIVLVKRLFDRDDVVRIGPSGIWYRHWSDDTIPWNQITGIGVWEYKRQRSLLLNLVDPARFPSTTLLGRMASSNRALTGGDIAISVLGTDRSFDELLAAVMAYRPQ